jgi:hypothetical protein
MSFGNSVCHFDPGVLRKSWCGALGVYQFGLGLFTTTPCGSHEASIKINRT